MVTVNAIFSETTEVNRSKFIAYLIAFDDFEIYLKGLREEHPKASHIVSAYRYINAYDQIVEAGSDDGEPKGCAGMPVLNVMRGKELVNSAILVVRYFGGIKLGTGGMARAYAAAAKNVLNDAVLIPYEKQIAFTFKTAYSDVDKTLYQLKQIGITQYDRDFGVDGVQWMIKAGEQKINCYKSYLAERGNSGTGR